MYLLLDIYLLLEVSIFYEHSSNTVTNNSTLCEEDNIINEYGTSSEGSIAGNVISENSAECSVGVKDSRVLIEEINVEPTFSALDGSEVVLMDEGFSGILAQGG